MKKNNNPSISESIQLIKKRIKEIRKNPDQENDKYFKEIEHNLNEIKKFAKGIKKLLLILLSVSFASLILFFISLYYNKKLENLNDDLNNQKVDSLMTKILSIETVDKGDTLTTSYDYYTRNGEVITYNELVEESDSLRSQNDSLSREAIQFRVQLYKLRQKLNLAEKTYGVKFENISKKEKGKNVEYIQMTAPKIDSGFMLLEKYRDRIYYDKDKNQWFVINKKQ